MELQKGKINITMDGQFGSTGKGVLNAYIAERFENTPDICVSNAAPNAGHTYVDANGKKRTTFHLPVSGVLLPETDIYMCAGSIIDPLLFSQELEDFDIDPHRVTIHPRACILLPEHKAREQSSASGATNIASTQKGVGAALGDKVARTRGTRVAKDYYCLPDDIRIAEYDLMEAMESGQTVLMEIPQGFSLSLNHGLSYPKCTSRDLTVAQALNDAGVHPSYLGEVIVSLRAFPIRVGHIVNKESGAVIGHSGPFYADSKELIWSELNQIPELTTVTKRVRRIATFSMIEFEKMLRMNRPTVVFLNFCNYFRTRDEFYNVVQKLYDMRLSYDMEFNFLFGTGPASKDVFSDYSFDEIWERIEAERNVEV